MIESNLSVYCLKYAESVLSENMILDGGCAEKYIPISFGIYLIKIEDRNILVDAGCNTMPDFDMKHFYSPAFVLRYADICAKDITDVIITHAHHDHIEAIKYFRNATIHITEKEFETGKGYIPDEFKVNIFSGEYNVTPRINVIEVGGHSSGSSIVEIKTEDCIHILAGDECYTNANIANGICTGSYFDKEKSIQFIKKYTNEKYRVHTCHDISLKTERIV